MKAIELKRHLEKLAGEAFPDTYQPSATFQARLQASSRQPPQKGLFMKTQLNSTRIIPPGRAYYGHRRIGPAVRRGSFYDHPPGTGPGAKFAALLHPQPEQQHAGANPGAPVVDHPNSRNPRRHPYDGTYVVRCGFFERNAAISAAQPVRWNRSVRWSNSPSRNSASSLIRCISLAQPAGQIR